MAATGPKDEAERRSELLQPSEAMKASEPNLLGIPPELRDQIWTYAVTDDKGAYSYLFPTPDFTKASRQIRSETLPLFYSCNTFTTQFRIDMNFVPVSFLDPALSARISPKVYNDPIEMVVSWLEHLRIEDLLKHLRCVEIWTLDDHHSQWATGKVAHGLSRMGLQGSAGIVDVVVKPVAEYDEWLDRDRR